MKLFDLKPGQKFRFRTAPNTVMMRVSEPLYGLEGYTTVSSVEFPDSVGNFFKFEGPVAIDGVNLAADEEIDLTN